ncbi:MAG: hypothetical protein U5S82_14810 [Gammaproteobacteria bacterium]|nr:hypothetical protein [Gammaproteobacteria bacterium]
MIELLEAAKRGEDLNVAVNQIRGVNKDLIQEIPPRPGHHRHACIRDRNGLCRRRDRAGGGDEGIRERVMPASPRQIGRWIDAIEPRAEKSAQAFAMMEKDPLVTKYPPPREE